MKKDRFQHINFYCDESCYIQKDGNSVMALASVFCSNYRIKNIKKDINDIKRKYGFPVDFEIKWTKVSQKTLEMYKEIIKYVADPKSYINVRILFTMGKMNLDFNTHPHLDYSRWFQRMYYHLLKTPMENIENMPIFYNYKLFIDKKDSHSYEDAKILSKTLQNSFNGLSEVFCDVYDSKDIVLIQIADLFAGATSYKNRNLQGKNKLEIIELIETCYGKKLDKTTQRSTIKFNVFEWEPEVKF